MDALWKRFKHLPQGVYHAFTAADETIAVCGRTPVMLGVAHLEDNLIPAPEGDFDKCKSCVYTLEGTLVIARMRRAGGGMLHS